MVVRVPDLPEHASVPIDLEHRAALEAPPRLEPLEIVHDLAAVEQVPVREQMAVEPRAIGQAPGVRDLPVHVHQIDGTVAVHRREQRVARLRARGVMDDEPGPGPPYFLLVYRARRRHVVGF